MSETPPSHWGPVTDSFGTASIGRADDGGFGERVAESYEAARRLDSSYGFGLLVNEEMQRRLDGIEAATGQRLPNPFTDRFEEVDEAAIASDFAGMTTPAGQLVDEDDTLVRRTIVQARMRALDARVSALAERAPGLETNEQFQAKLRARAAELDAQADDAGFFAQLLGGIGAAATDPLSYVVPGGGGRTVLGVAARSAVSGAAGEAILQPAVQGGRRRLGLDYGFDDAALNIAAGAAFGGALGGGAKAASDLFSRRGKAKALAELGEDQKTPDTEAARAALDKDLATDDAAMVSSNSADVADIVLPRPDADDLETQRRTLEREVLGFPGEDDGASSQAPLPQQDAAPSAPPPPEATTEGSERLDLPPEPETVELHRAAVEAADEAAATGDLAGLDVAEGAAASALHLPVAEVRIGDIDVTPHDRAHAELIRVVLDHEAGDDVGARLNALLPLFRGRAIFDQVVTRSLSVDERRSMGLPDEPIEVTDAASALAYLENADRELTQRLNASRSRLLSQAVADEAATRGLLSADRDFEGSNQELDALMNDAFGPEPKVLDPSAIDEAALADLDEGERELFEMASAVFSKPEDEREAAAAAFVDRLQGRRVFEGVIDEELFDEPVSNADDLLMMAQQWVDRARETGDLTELEMPILESGEATAEYLQDLLTRGMASVADREAAAAFRPSEEVELDDRVSFVIGLDPNDIRVDAVRFQFKSGGDDKGVTDALRDVEAWDTLKADPVMVWRDLSGTLYVVDGHQRTGLARRLKAQGQDVRLSAYILDQSKGISDEEARMVAALKNIAQGSGTAVDAAKVLRVNPARVAELPPRGALVRVARDLARLGDDAFQMIVNEVVDPRHAAMVGRLVSDPAEQVSLLGLLAKQNPRNLVEAEALINQAQVAGFAKAEQDSLFGVEAVSESLLMERAAILGAAVSRLRKDKSLFKTLSVRSDDIEAVGNQLDRAKNQEISQSADEVANIVLRTAHVTGPVADALQRATLRVRDGGLTRGAAVREFLNDIRGITIRDLGSRGVGSADGAGARTDGSSTVSAEADGRSAAQGSGLDPASDLFDVPSVGAERQRAELERDVLGTAPDADEEGSQAPRDAPTLSNPPGNVDADAAPGQAQAELTLPALPALPRRIETTDALGDDLDEVVLQWMALNYDGSIEDRDWHQLADLKDATGEEVWPLLYQTIFLLARPNAQGKRRVLLTIEENQSRMTQRQRDAAIIQGDAQHYYRINDADIIRKYASLAAEWERYTLRFLQQRRAANPSNFSANALRSELGAAQWMPMEAAIYRMRGKGLLDLQEKKVGRDEVDQIFTLTDGLSEDGPPPLGDAQARPAAAPQLNADEELVVGLAVDGPDVVPDIVTRRQLIEEVQQEDAMLARLESCVVR